MKLGTIVVLGFVFLWATMTVDKVLLALYDIGFLQYMDDKDRFTFAIVITAIATFFGIMELDRRARRE